MSTITVTIPCGKEIVMRELAGKPGKYIGWIPAYEGGVAYGKFMCLHELEELFPVKITYESDSPKHQ